MSRKSREARALALAKASAAVALGVAVLPSPAAAALTVGQGASAKVKIVCDLPFVGFQPFYADIQSNIPSSWEQYRPTDQFQIQINALGRGSTYGAFDLGGVTSIAGAVRTVGATTYRSSAAATVKVPGANLAVTVPLTVDPTTKPDTPPVEPDGVPFTISGLTPKLTFNTAGVGTGITADSVKLFVQGFNADGDPVPDLDTSANEDGDTSTFPVNCTPTTLTSQDVADGYQTLPATLLNGLTVTPDVTPPVTQPAPTAANLADTSVTINGLKTWDGSKPTSQGGIGSFGSGVNKYEVFFNGVSKGVINQTAAASPGAGPPPISFNVTGLNPAPPTA